MEAASPWRIRWAPVALERSASHLSLDTEAAPHTWGYCLTGPGPASGVIDSLDALADVLTRHGGLLTDDLP
ncbi:hypothetical protein ACN6A1_04745 [Myxococcus virescens]|uniref:hypothetical protein n=1 Tax=Myxococcus virescens TaxID=83456 RepID=UPI003DA2A047